jgi:hypothetical protein
MGFVNKVAFKNARAMFFFFQSWVEQATFFGQVQKNLNFFLGGYLGPYPPPPKSS